MPRPLIQMALRRVRDGSGTDAYLRQSRTMMQSVPDLRTMLPDVPFAIRGGLATRLYMQERMTLDVDILVAIADYPEASRRLAASGAELRGPLTIGGGTWQLPGDQCLDVIALDRLWVHEALCRPVEGKDRQPYLDLPWLVLMKLEAGRAQDLADLSRMLGGQDEPILDRVRDAVRRFAPNDIDDLKSLIQLGRNENN